MKDEHKTQAELIEELNEAKRQIADLKMTKKNRGQAAESLAQERDRITEELRTSEEKYRTLVETMNDGLVVEDRDGILTYTNHRLCEMLGYGADEIVGKPLKDLFDPVGQSILQEQTTKRKTGEQTVYEIPWKKKDGQTIHTLIAGSPFVDAAGKLTGSFGVVTDITDRKRMEEKLKQNEIRLRTIFEASIDGLLVCDTEGIIAESNPAAAEMHGYEPGELAGTRLSRIVHQDHWTALDEIIDAAAQGRQHSTSLATLGKDGSTVRLEARGKPIVFKGKPHLLVVVQDVTDRLKAEEENRQLNQEIEEKIRRRTAELEAANQEIDAFARSVSNHLRPPLKSADELGRALAETCKDRLDPQGRDLLDSLCAAVLQMNGLVDGLLGLSQITQKTLTREQVDLSRMAAKIADELKSTDPGRDVTFVIAENLEINGDAALLSTMLENLLGNAWKFTARQPSARIELGAVEHEGTGAFFVRDNGVGFDMKHSDHLFGPFQRLHPAAEFGGAGIGLAKVKRILSRHGGRIWVQAEKGNGAAFYFTL